ncbi:serine hydrolase FSH [Aspergillus cavernicola]|uniref:Serine hydrolase FSH n=1 Tax=Aspergillus cavernicola TaxID=176166 RepID=A0ABR4HC71_9EURO
MGILCLHGFGANPVVMKHQMSVLAKYFDTTWEFHFLPGPVGCPAAPGVAKTFPGPYLCWTLDFDPITNRTALDLIHQTIMDRGPFDGVFGFSQGASIVAAYLLEQAELHPDKPLPVRFAIFCSSPPILAGDPEYIQRLFGALSAENIKRFQSAKLDQVAQLPAPVRASAIVLLENLAVMAPVHGKSLSHYLDRPPAEIPCVVLPDQYKARLSIPTLHVCGKDDPPSMRKACAINASFCAPKWRRHFNHSSIHNLPRSPTEAQEMVSHMAWIISHSQLSRI